MQGKGDLPNDQLGKLAHKLTIGLAVLKFLDDVSRKEGHTVISPGESSVNGLLHAGPDRIASPPDGLFLFVVSHPNLEDHRESLRVRGNDMDAADKKRILSIRIVLDFMSPGQHNPITRKEYAFRTICRDFTMARATPKQHAGLDPPACDSFGWSELEPIRKDNDWTTR